MEYTLQDILANWKYRREKEKKEEAVLGQYNKLPHSLEELEKLIVEKLPLGGVLSAYSKVSRTMKDPLGLKTQEEIFRLYELCDGQLYFDVFELDEIFKMDYHGEMPEEKFRELCMDIIVRCPVTITESDKLSGSQEILFRLGDEEDVWTAYNKNFFPKDILEELYEKMKAKHCNKTRLSWIIAWMSV